MECIIERIIVIKSNPKIKPSAMAPKKRALPKETFFLIASKTNKNMMNTLRIAGMCWVVIIHLISAQCHCESIFIFSHERYQEPEILKVQGKDFECFYHSQFSILSPECFFLADNLCRGTVRILNDSLEMMNDLPICKP